MYRVDALVERASAPLRPDGSPGLLLVDREEISNVYLEVGLASHNYCSIGNIHTPCIEHFCQLQDSSIDPLLSWLNTTFERHVSEIPIEFMCARRFIWQSALNLILVVNTRA